MVAKRAQLKAQPAPKLDDGKQLVRLRRICAVLPGVVEKISHGAPTFFTPNRVFAMFADNTHGDGRIAVWLPAAPGVQAVLIDEAPDTHFRPPYVGVKEWVGVELSKVTDDQLGALIREGFRLCGRQDFDVPIGCAGFGGCKAPEAQVIDVTAGAVAVAPLAFRRSAALNPSSCDNIAPAREPGRAYAPRRNVE